MGNITFLGVEGSGKTVLTMALVNAFKAHEHEGWFLRPETRGAFRFLEQVPSELKEGTLPHQTTALRQLAWSVVKDGEHQQTLDILDYPGEVYRLAFLNAEDENDPDEFRARVQAHQEEIKGLLGHLIQSEHIFVLFNLSDAKDLGSNAKNLDAVWVTNACLDYLHRLPHKPRITLLLTQIDKYVDLEQYEFDPKVYVSHHLPLIARNFPNLDVCAVAALGAADSTHGIDSILVRSLFNAPAVQTAIGKIQEARRTLKQALNTDVINVHFCTAVVDAIMHLACDAPYWKKILPWFIKPEKLISSNGLLDVETTEECKGVVGEFYVLLQKSKTLPLRRCDLMQFVQHLSPSTSEANVIVRSIDDSLRRVEQERQNLLRLQAKRQTQVYIGVTLAVIVVIILVVVVTICLRDTSRTQKTRVRQAPSKIITEMIEQPVVVKNTEAPRSMMLPENPEEWFQKGLDDERQKNYEDAVKWYRKAVEQGHVNAQYALGLCHYYGNGVCQSPSEAAKWFRKSAEQGLASAQYALGVCYANGDGVPLSYSEAVKWFRKAAVQGDVEAQYSLGRSYEYGNGVVQSWSEAVNWYRKSAEQGNAMAQCGLGFCYEYGNGVVQSHSEAVKWFRKAAVQGNVSAQFALFACHLTGTGVPQSSFEAVKWLRKAAEQGYVLAQAYLAMCYEEGSGVTIDYPEAVKWYRKAAEQGNEEAIERLNNAKTNPSDRLNPCL